MPATFENVVLNGTRDSAALRSQRLRLGDIPDDLDGPNLVMWGLKSSELSPAGARKEVQKELKPEGDAGCSYMQWLVPSWQLARKMGTRPTATGTEFHKQPEWAWKHKLSPSLLRNAQASWQPDFSPVRPLAEDPAELGCAHISKLCKCDVINVCCLKPLSLWWFVPAAIEN